MPLYYNGNILYALIPIVGGLIGELILNRDKGIFGVFILIVLFIFLILLIIFSVNVHDLDLNSIKGDSVILTKMRTIICVQVTLLLAGIVIMLNNLTYGREYNGI